MTLTSSPADILVAAIVAAEILLPIALVFWAGRQWERRSQERAVSRGAAAYLGVATRGSFGVATHGAAAGETVEVLLGPADPPVRLPSSLREGHGFPRSRKRRRH